MLVCLDNLERDYLKDKDAGRVSRFVDTILTPPTKLSPEGLYWCLEPNDFADPAEFSVKISKRVDRILVHLSSDGKQIMWVAKHTLDELSMNEAVASKIAFENLARALREAELETQTTTDGVKLGFLSTTLPFKSSLILAPNLKDVIGKALGWPLMAVAPDRDFLYLWAARHSDFVRRVGEVVLREYEEAAYPISTEVYEITDTEIRAVGAFKA